MKLLGLFLPVTVPFDSQGNLYQAKVRGNFAKWNLTGLAGYVVGACEGELLSSEEKCRLWEWAAPSAGEGKIKIAAAGAESVRETVELAGRAAELGYDAILVNTPRYNPDLYFRSVADRSRLPLLVSTNLPEAASLASHPNVSGLVGDPPVLSRWIREAGPDFPVLAGSGSLLWPALMLGAAGGLIASANAAPYAAIALWEAFRTREYEAARDWQDRLSRAESALSRHGVPGLKHAMDLNGYYGGPPRLPQCVPDPDARKEIEAAFRGL